MADFDDTIIPGTFKHHKFDIPPLVGGTKPAIKAIPTLYNGNFYRSRTEARFAVFFDELDIHFIYELQGWEIKGVGYLPDFWLPFPSQYNLNQVHNAGRWYEIKGQVPSDREILKVVNLARATGYTSYIVAGLPGDHRSLCASPNGHYIWEAWDESPLGQEHDDIWNIMLLFHPYLIGLENANYHIGEAILKAKQARFEFGEKG